MNWKKLPLAQQVAKNTQDISTLNSNLNKLLVVEKTATIAGGSSSGAVATSVDMSDSVPNGYTMIGCALGGYTLPYYDNNGNLLTFAQRFTGTKSIVIKNKTDEWANTQIRALFIKP